MKNIGRDFKRALKSSNLMRSFSRNAALTAGIAGISTAVLQTMNRSALGGEIMMDSMTLSGLALLASTLVLLPADRLPFLKRISGAQNAGTGPRGAARALSTPFTELPRF